MTLFTIAAKKVIDVMIETTRVTSTEADRSATNGILSLVGFGRDLTLSKAKREQIAALLPKIIEIPDSLDDKVALERLQGLIRQCRHDMEEQTTKHKIGTGNTEGALEGICSLLQNIYDKLNLLNLLNTPYDTENRDPLNNFKKHVAFFYAEKFTAEQSLNIVDKLKRVPVRGDKIELTEQQNTLVTQSLSTLSTQLTILDNRLASIRQSESQTIENQKLKHYIVALALLNLKTQNEELCAHHQPKIGLSILNPDDGILTERLQIALTEIGYPAELAPPTLRRPPTTTTAAAEHAAGLDSLLSPERDEGRATPENSSTHAVLTALHTDTGATAAAAAAQPISPGALAWTAPGASSSKTQQKKMKKSGAASAAGAKSEDELTASP